MRITIRKLKQLIKEATSGIEEISDAELDAIAEEGHEINAKLKAMKTHDPSVSNPLYRKRSALIDRMRGPYNKLRYAWYDARREGPPELADELKEKIDHMLHVACIDVMNYNMITDEVFWTEKEVYGSSGYLGT